MGNFAPASYRRSAQMSALLLLQPLLKTMQELAVVVITSMKSTSNEPLSGIKDPE